MVDPVSQSAGVPAAPAAPLVVAVVGAAGWGQNVVRAFYLAAASTLRWVCDRNGALLPAIEARFPGVRTTQSFDEVLADPAVGAVAVATDVPNRRPQPVSPCGRKLQLSLSYMVTREASGLVNPGFDTGVGNP